MAELRKIVFVAHLAVFLAALSPASAHHSFAGQFDINSPVEFTGVVTRVEWQNPHVWIYVDAEDENGNLIHYEAESTNPNTLLRRGWRHDSLKPGDQVTVEGFRAHCCENVVNAANVTLADGRKVYARDGR